MNRGGAVAAAALVAMAGAASAQVAEVVVDRGFVDLDDPDDDGLAAFSLWLDRQGSTAGYFASFSGWAKFGGVFRVGRSGSARGASFVDAADSGTYTEVEVAPGVFVPESNGDWLGRRAPSRWPLGYDEAFGIPAGSWGGFRTTEQGYEVDGGVLSGVDGGAIEGLQCPSSIYGHHQDPSARIEVFRGVVDMRGAEAGVYSLEFDVESLWVFLGGAPFMDDFYLARSVISETRTIAGLIEVVPGPGVVAPLAVVALARARRRGGV